MAFARDVYTASAAQTDFTISFSYLDDAHIVVTKDGVTLTEVTDYTFPNATTVRLVVAATGGETIVLTRSTSQSTRLVDYTAGVLVESDLDNDSLQAFYMSQEAIDQVTLSLGKDTSELWDAESTRIINVGTPSASTDAVTKAYVDAISAAAGNVPTPGNPGEDNYILSAGGGTWAWESPATIKSDLSLGALADLNTVDTAQIDASAVETAKINDDAVTLAKMEHGTSGDVLYYGASGVPTRLAKGTDDQVLTLASGLPSWAAAAGGMWEYEEKATVSAGTEADFTDLLAGYDYRFIVRRHIPDADNRLLLLRTSTDNGSTFNSTASDYEFTYSYQDAGAADVQQYNTAATSCYLVTMTDSAGGGGYLDLLLYDPMNASYQTKYVFHAATEDSGGILNHQRGAGMRDNKEANDAIRFLGNAGTFSAVIERWRRAHG